MQLADPLAEAWRAQLHLRFGRAGKKTVLLERTSDGPLVVQKPLYPEGESVCHAIVVHPPGGIAGGDELFLQAKVEKNAAALLTTPGAGKWYRSAGSWAGQSLDFDVQGTLEWLPRETIVFDGALARLESTITLGEAAKFIGWEVVCLGRSGAGERFERGKLKIGTRVNQGSRMLFIEKGEIDGGGRLLQSPAGLGGRSVFGTFIATSGDSLGDARKAVPELALTQLQGLLVARYLGDSSEQALQSFTRLWKVLRPNAVEPRIWST
jgi:urease accessory protein